MLLIVTLVLATLSLSGAALLLLMKAERGATDVRGLDALVKGVDRSAVVFLISAVESTPEEREKFGGLYDNPDYFQGTELLKFEEGGADASRFTVVSPKFTDAKIEGVRYGLTDESTKLNLDAVLAWDAENPGAGREALLKLPGMTPIAADSILDWIDPDERPRSNGAEASYYSSKKLPYSPRNAVPVFLEEILLARGATRSQLYGTDEDFTYGAEKIDPNEGRALGGSLILGGASSSERSNDAVPWKELLTVFSAEKDVDPTGSARVDLNGADLQFLYRELAPRVGDDLAKFVVLYRQYGPRPTPESNSNSSPARGAGRAGARGRRESGYSFRGAANRNASANSGENEPTKGNLASVNLDFSKESETTLASPLDIVGAQVVVGNVVYDSPIPDSQNARVAENLFKFLDYASTNDSTTIVGRVNVNVASQIVLSAIPGLGAADVRSIMDNRPDPAKRLPDDYRHASWLYTKGLVNLQKMKSLYNKTTARGDVYRGQIIGFLEGSDETARAEVVIDGTTIPPRQVFYKDLTTLGKGFEPSVLLGEGASKDPNDSTMDAPDWRTVETDLFEIDSERTSGYNQFGDPSADPFAAIDAQFGSANATGPAASPRGNAALDPFATTASESALGSGFGATEDPTSPASAANSTNGSAPSSGALGARAGGTNRNGAAGALATASSSDATAATSASSESPATDSTTDSSASEPEDGESRKERLLNALRTMRDMRRARYDAANGTSDSSAGSAGAADEDE
ncbi:MAG: general secretion pathway protein GspK [Thermoguttaceae bacterium]|nr:general secretion pathway protein GspK [Thermoguttaceae bacterium]